MATTNLWQQHRLLRAHDWQDRPEFDRLLDWWRSTPQGGLGVCALVGIGGAGKTAIADRFLQCLPGAFPGHPKVPKRDDLPPAERVFVFSFYDEPNADAFFRQLGEWLGLSEVKEGGGERERVASYQLCLRELQSAPRCLLALDGLEKVQEDGSRGIFGRLADGRLRDFLSRLADGYLPQISVLITTRFALLELVAQRPYYFWQIPVERLSEEAAVKLLRKRGVKKGTDGDLAALAREHGLHALTIDLVGGYIGQFCGGDPDSLPNLGATDLSDLDPNTDPRALGLIAQERKFARVAERYRESLKESDPAALALLERVCLFRLGVGAGILADIFLGEDKAKVAGRALAGLSRKELDRKLAKLVQMRLLEENRRPGNQKGELLYTIHPAVRDGLLSGLDRETERLGHQAAREGIEAWLGASPGDNPSDPAVLDLLEEIVHHTLNGGLVKEAWDLYRNRIGAYGNLGHRLGDYERGERICRAIAAGIAPRDLPAGEEGEEPGDEAPDGRNPTETVRDYRALDEGKRAMFINEWALYLKNLGRLDEAARCCEIQIQMRMRQKKWSNASIGNQNFADSLLLAGRLRAGRSAAEEALRLADLAEDPRQRYPSHAHHGHALALAGSEGLDAFREALRWQKEYETRVPPLHEVLWSLPGIFQAQLLGRLGRHGEAEELTRRNMEILDPWGEGDPDKVQCKLLLAELALASRVEGEAAQAILTAASSLRDSAREWALRRDAKEVLVGAARVSTLLALAKPDVPGTAESEIAEGLRLAREHGCGIEHIDLLLLRARLRLRQGRPQDALADVKLALDDGIHPDPETGLPELLAARDPECGYAWGIVEGLHLRGEALLLRAAQAIGSDAFAPAKLNEQPEDVRKWIEQAKQCLHEALAGWQPLHDPEPERPDQNVKLDGKEYNYRAAKTHEVLVQLEGGVLTRYPLEAPDSDPVTTPPSSNPAPIPEPHPTPIDMPHDIFLSYCRNNMAEAALVHSDLEAAGLTVWWDQLILPGQSWRLEIKKAMAVAKAVVVCFSNETAARKRTGIYPELLDAIAEYRTRPPGSVYLVPVRFSDCEMPVLELGGSQMLSDLNHVDLFPAADRAANLAKLIQGLRTAI